MWRESLLCSYDSLDDFVWPSASCRSIFILLSLLQPSSYYSSFLSTYTLYFLQSFILVLFLFYFFSFCTNSSYFSTSLFSLSVLFLTSAMHSHSSRYMTHRNLVRQFLKSQFLIFNESRSSCLHVDFSPEQ